MKGWLGEHTIEEFYERWVFDQPMECHMTVDYEDSNKTHIEQIVEGETVSYCAGALIMARNCFKRSRDPDRPVMEADHEMVFSNSKEFREYHDTEEHRNFMERLRS
tara:strand:+ start:290 stop:607 length:318 start_codon:yes stop_codon:yes gene_type:complete